MEKRHTINIYICKSIEFHVGQHHFWQTVQRGLVQPRNGRLRPRSRPEDAARRRPGVNLT